MQSRFKKDASFDSLVKRLILDPLIHARDTGRLYVKAQRNYVFLCGADVKQSSTVRRRLFDYMREHWRTKLSTFLAEDYDAADTEAHHGNLLEMEVSLGRLADCIIVVNESMSAAAELGAFSLSEELAPRMIVVNDIAFKEKASFINRGPIAKIEKSRGIPSPIIWSSFENTAKILDALDERLRKIEKQRASPFARDRTDKNQAKHHMALFIDLIALLQPVETDYLVSTMRQIAGCSAKEVASYRAILRSAQLLFEEKRDNIQVQFLADPIVDYQTRIDSVSYESVRSKIYNHYYSRGYPL